jgi:hypothetical protein
MNWRSSIETQWMLTSITNAHADDVGDTLY